jgi:hypothetical protein
VHENNAAPLETREDLDMEMGSFHESTNMMRKSTGNQDKYKNRDTLHQCKILIEQICSASEGNSE